jgi:hypothetical protein
MKDFIKSTLSRKFLLTLAGVVVFYYNKQYDQMTILILGYVGIVGGADIVTRYKNGSLTASDVETVLSQNDDAPDTSKVVTGKDVPLFDEKEKES